MRKRPRSRRTRQKRAIASDQTLSATPPSAPIALSVAASKPWFHEGIQFGCTGCGACCRRPGYVWLSKPDIARMADHLGLSVEDFRDCYTQEITIDGQDEP